MKNTREELLNGTIRLVAEGGPGAARMRAIARAAGVTEAAIYKHYANKDALLGAAYRRIVDEMVAEKQHLAAGERPFRETTEMWVRLTFASFDANPDAFRYVLLTPGTRPEEDDELAGCQGQLFLDLVRRAMDAGEIPEVDPRLALSHFTGLMLNVPRMITEGTLSGPASDYVEAVVDAIWRVLGPPPGPDAPAESN
jgi:AcrR family transcriptional regulator